MDHIATAIGSREVLTFSARPADRGGVMAAPLNPSAPLQLLSTLAPPFVVDCGWCRAARSRWVLPTGDAFVAASGPLRASLSQRDAIIWRYFARNPPPDLD